MQRWLELPPVTQTTSITDKTRNVRPHLGQGTRPLLEKGWMKALQGANTGAMRIKEDTVWLPKTARASLSQRPGILSFLGMHETQSHLLLLQLGCVFIWLICNQQICGRMNLMGLFSPSCLPQQDPGQ